MALRPPTRAVRQTPTPEDVGGTMPGVETEETGRSPIGVPQGYTTPLWQANIPGLPAPQLPVRYHEGHEWLPARMSAEDIARLQLRMEDAGVLGDDYQVGAWDKPSRDAYRELLGLANASGVGVGQAIDNYAQSVPRTEEAGQKLPTFNVSNPDDLRAIFKTAAQNTIGKFVPDDQIEAMISAYQSAQMAPQQQETADQLAGGGGTVTSAPSPQTFAEAEIRKRNPVEAGANDFIKTFNTFLQGIGEAG